MKKVDASRLQVVKEFAAKGASKSECARYLGISLSNLCQFCKANDIEFMSNYDRILNELDKLPEVTYSDIKKYGYKYFNQLKNHYGVYKNLFDETGDPIYKRNHTNRLYHRYIDMLQRCTNPNNCIYNYYGAKGIKVCDEWVNGKFDKNLDGFDAFALWSVWNGYDPEMGNKLQIDRIDNRKDYSPDNCRWVEPVINLNNKSNSIRIVHNGLHYTISDYAIATNTNKSTIIKQIKRGCIESIKLY